LRRTANRRGSSSTCWRRPAGHLLGTDDLGANFSRLIYGAPATRLMEPARSGAVAIGLPVADRRIFRRLDRRHHQPGDRYVFCRFPAIVLAIA